MSKKLSDESESKIRFYNRGYEAGVKDTKDKILEELGILELIEEKIQAHVESYHSNE